jgi:phage terminase large subunit-like protein
MEEIALLSPEEQEEALRDLDPEGLVWDWSMWGRPEQIPPNDDSWNIGLFLAGRGAGKTRSASEWIREKARYTNQGKLRFLLVARTAADARQVMVTGESGILNVTPPSERPEYKSSVRELLWPNGNSAFITTADEPDSLRGPQAHYAWGDEIAAWRLTPDQAGMTAWGNLRVATRLGRTPQILATTTPKRVPILFDLIEEQKKTGKVWITRGSTYDNAGNLGGAYLDSMEAQFGHGSSQARQELFGEMLDAIDGALWNDELLARARYMSLKPPFTPLRVVGVDPSVAENPRDECGIVVVGSSAEPDLYRRTAYVIEDLSLKGSPTAWAQVVVDAARRWQCPVVAEVNQGGTLVANAIHQIDPSIEVLEVFSKVGKKLRAEPVTLAYEQGRVKHLNVLGDLETQMTTWMPETSAKSPDRVDALVHALTALLIKPPKGFHSGRISAKSPSKRRLNAGPSAARSSKAPGGFRISR